MVFSFIRKAKEVRINWVYEKGMIHELLLALNGCHGDIFAYNEDTGMIEVRLSQIVAFNIALFEFLGC